jgi:hypothetical protein
MGAAMRRSVLVLGLAGALVSGCASSAATNASGPSGSGSSTAASGSTTASTSASALVLLTSTSTPSPSPSPTETKPKYGFGLPSGPTAPGPELLLYEPLRQGDCDAAQISLGAPDQGGNWSSLPDPAKVLLFQAGVDACKGDLSAAGSQLALDRTLFGATTKENLQEADSACPLYQGLVSVLDQVAPASVQCPVGPEPQWQSDANDNPIDPRTHPDAYAHLASSPASSPTLSQTPSLTPSPSGSPGRRPPLLPVRPSLIRLTPAPSKAS